MSVGLMPAVGSSSSSTVGSFISAIANSSSFCWPKERLPARSNAFLVQADEGEQLLGSRGRRRRRRENMSKSARRRGDVLIACSPCNSSCRRCASSGTCAAGRGARSAARADFEISSPSKRIEPESMGGTDDGIEQRGLARAVRADQPGDRAAGTVSDTSRVGDHAAIAIAKRRSLRAARVIRRPSMTGALRSACADPAVRPRLRAAPADDAVREEYDDRRRSAPRARRTASRGSRSRSLP